MYELRGKNLDERKYYESYNLYELKWGQRPILKEILLYGKQDGLCKNLTF